MNTKQLEKMLPRGSRVLCAVSGGADSMCMLHLLKSREAALAIEVFAAHYEHGLRGEESLRDEGFVRDFCLKNGIALVVEHGDVRSFADANGMSTEEAARALRYDFLDKAARELSCSLIATAHNADDNAETMLFNLCRGTGAAGLRGIPPARGRIIRPLLEHTRAEIEQYLEENGVSHVEDSSNLADEYSRNLIRHKVMPVLRQINAGFVPSALKTAELLRRDEQYLSRAAGEFIARFYDGQSLPAQALSEAHFSIASRVVRQLCKKSLSLSHVESVLALCEGQSLAYIDVPGQRIKRDRGRLYFIEPKCAEIVQREIRPGQTVLVPELGLKIRASVTIYTEEINDLFKTYYFKYESICDSIFLTGRRSGDKLRPQGRGCTKSLKSLFLEAGMNQSQRAAALVFRDEKGVLAVYGLAVEQRTAASRGDKVLRLDIERICEENKGYGE